MNALTRFERLNDFFPDFFRGFPRPSRLADDLPNDIPIDVSETDKQYEVRAEVPGVRKDDIRVTVNRNFVSISAEVKREKEEKQGKRVLLTETCTGMVSRSFTLEHEVDEKDVSAKLDNGVLTLTLPKREGSSSRTIAIK
ncbi:Hsp20/alpha crystallin family protein [Piscinibacter sp. HJYY11]|uniref:Hsp20/alpha crystallin family protein n=1 Tax=Piscinibacter sp. HJYY11 TaxID=2801333 RepID=UPI00191CC629|nr:Hsp20/alpha crystallin family protein [Piscinibacter sp. HJYY11]MBL0726628.1 Hsp20/alpha crystallin family protein [Piscinibacter sp. HJYY11]